MESLIDIDIKEVSSPSEFKARILLPAEQASYQRAFCNWQAEMEVIKRNTVINHAVDYNDIYAVKDHRDNKWYRVRVENVLYTAKGQQASCYFVDTGEHNSFLLQRVYKLPERYQEHEVPFQVRTMKLWGLQPLTLMLEATITGIHVPQRPTNKWDPSAETYFIKITEESQQALVLIKEQEGNGQLQVILYLRRQDHLLNVNDHLINEEYACALSPVVKKELNPSELHCDRTAERKLSARLSPIDVTVISSSGKRMRHQLDLRSISSAAEFCSDNSTKAEDVLTEEKLKNVMYKVNYFTHHNKYDSDTEAMKRSRGKVKVRSRPPLGSRLRSKVGDSSDSFAGSHSCVEVGRSSLSSGDQDSWAYSDCEHASSVHNGLRSMPVDTPSDSDNSCYFDLQRCNNTKGSSRGGGLNSIQSNCGTSPVLPEHNEIAASGHMRHIHTSCGQPAIIPCPSKSAAAACNVGLSCGGDSGHSSLTSASGANPFRVNLSGDSFSGGSLLAVNSLGVTPFGETSGVTSSGMSTLGVTASGVNSVGVAPSGMTSGMTPLKVIPSRVALGLTPPGVTPSEMTTSKVTLPEVTSGVSPSGVLSVVVSSGVTSEVTPSGVTSSGRTSGVTLSEVTSGGTPLGVTSGGTLGVTSGGTPLGLTSRGIPLEGTSSKVVSVGRGRGLRKLCIEDVATFTSGSCATNAKKLIPDSSPAVSNKPKLCADDSSVKERSFDKCASPLSDASVASGSISKYPSDSSKAVSQESRTETGISMNSMKNSAEDLQQSDPTNQAGMEATPTATAHDMMSLNAPVEVLTSAAALANRKPSLEEYHKRQQVLGDGRMDGANTSSNTGSPSLLDVGRLWQARMQRGSGDPDFNGSVLPPDISLREIDLNLESPQSVSSSDRLTELLRTVVKSSDDSHCEIKVPLVWRPDRPMPKPLLGTITWGIHLPQPVFDVEDIQLNSIVKQYMIDQEFRNPRAIQAYAWPAFIRGRHIIGITPSSTGKTTAYLPALVSELLKFSKYHKLPKGMGPKAVILVPSCKKADAINRYVQEMIGNKTTLKTFYIYGSEDYQVMPLLRGVDLLVATPACLLRMLQQRYTHLDRLCHLVLDKMEILLHDFAPEMQKIMEIYVHKVKEYKDLPVTRQVLAFGCNWSSAVEDFQRAYQPDPVLVFASRLEASVYGRVKQVVHMCCENVHLTMLKNVMDKLMADPEQQRIVIATATEKNIIKINELLKSQSILAHVVDFNASISDTEMTVSQWMDQTLKAILVVTDNNVCELRVTCADTVLHYDLPDSQTKFGNRLALMLDYFQDSCNKPVSQKRGVSHLIVTNKMLDRILSLHSFLQRSGAAIPSFMTELLEYMKQEWNKDQNRAFCPRIMELGWCKNNKCENRHLVLPSDVIKEGSPEDWLPTSGIVKLRVLSVVDTSHYYVMLLEHQLPGQPCQDLQSRHTSLTMDLAMYFADERNHFPHYFEQGKRLLAAVKDIDGIFHRARMLKDLQTTLVTGSRQVEVLYVDEGRKAIVKPDQLLKLPPRFQDIPPLAVEVYICRVKPVDGDSEWTQNSKTYVNQLKGKDLIGNVILRMKNTLWLDPLAEQKRLQNVKTTIITMIVRSDLLRQGHAHDNPDHVKNLYKACNGLIPIEKKLYRKYLNLQQRKEIETEALRSDEQFHDVHISVVDNPHLFFLQKTCNQKALDKMNEELQKYMARELQGEKYKSSAQTPAKGAKGKSSTDTAANLRADGSAPVSGVANTNFKTGLDEKSSAAVTAGAAAAETTEAASKNVKNVLPMSDAMKSSSDEMFEQGCLCVAKFNSDGRWYRAQVMEIAEESCQVFFVDYGERDKVMESNIHPIPDQFCKLPAQAIECSLAYVSPIGKEWSENSSNLILDLASTASGNKKHLVAQVICTERAEFAGATRFVVAMYDTFCWGQDMSFSQELLWAQEATVTEDSKIANLFPKGAFTHRRLYQTLDARMTDLCATIYWMQEENKQKQLMNHLCCILEGLELHEDLSLGYEGLQQSVQLVGYLRSWDIQSSLLSALVACIKASPWVCATILNRQLMLRLVFCMEQVRNPVVQLQALSTAVQLARIEGFTPCMDQKEIILAMIDILTSDDPSPQTLQHVCVFLSYILTHGTRGLEAVEAEEMVPDVFSIMREVNDPDTLEMLLSLVAALASHTQHHNLLLREKHIQHVLNIMKEMPSQRCVFHCSQICHYLCQAHRRNKRLLLEGGLVLIINDLLQSGVQNPARQLCEELHRMLAVSGLQHQVLSGVHVTAAATSAEHSIIHMPSMKWSQNSFRVLLTVSVNGAKESDFRITNSSVHMRSECGGRTHGFDFELYDGVDPNKCRITVHQREAIVSLAKRNKGKWSRLLQKKQKFLKLQTDFDKLVDSSESEVEEPENIAMLTCKKKFRIPDGQTKTCSYGKMACEADNDDAHLRSSDSEEENLGSCSDDERFADPEGFIDPVAVTDDLIRRYWDSKRMTRTENTQNTET